MPTCFMSLLSVVVTRLIPSMLLLLLVCAALVEPSAVKALTEPVVNDEERCIVHQADIAFLQQVIDNCPHSTVKVIGASHYSPEHTIGCLVISNRTNLRVTFQNIFRFSPLLCPNQLHSEFLRIERSVNVSIVGLNLIALRDSTSQLTTMFLIMLSDRIEIERLTLKLSMRQKQGYDLAPRETSVSTGVAVVDSCATVTITKCDVTLMLGGGAPPQVDLLQIVRSKGVTVEACNLVMPLEVGRVLQAADVTDLRLTSSRFVSSLGSKGIEGSLVGGYETTTGLSFASLCAVRVEGLSSGIKVVDNRFEVRCGDSSGSQATCLAQRYWLEFIQVRTAGVVSRLVVSGSVLSVVPWHVNLPLAVVHDMGSVFTFISVTAGTLRCSIIDNITVSGLSGIHSAAVVLDVSAISDSVVGHIKAHDAVLGGDLGAPFKLRSRVPMPLLINPSACHGELVERNSSYPQLDVRGMLRDGTTSPAEGCPPPPSGTVSVLTAGLLCGGSAAVVAIGFLTGICIKVKALCRKASSTPSIDVESGAEGSTVSGPLLGDAKSTPEGEHHSTPLNPEETAQRDDGDADADAINNNATDGAKKELFVAMPQSGHWGARAERGVGTLWKWGQAAVRSRSHSNSASTISCGSSDSPRFVRAQYQPPSVLRGTADDCPFPHPGNHAAGSMSRRVNSCSIHSSEFSTSTEASLNNSTGSLN